MTKAITWTQAELDRHNRKMKLQRGDPEFETEAEFQATAERWLRQAGFMPRTPAWIANHHGRRWYIHLNKTKANPIMGDLLLIATYEGLAQSSCIEIELKNGNAPLSTEQGYLLKRKEIVVCRNMDEFKTAVYEWSGKD